MWTVVGRLAVVRVAAWELAAGELYGDALSRIEQTRSEPMRGPVIRQRCYDGDSGQVRPTRKVGSGLEKERGGELIDIEVEGGRPGRKKHPPVGHTTVIGRTSACF